MKKLSLLFLMCLCVVACASTQIIPDTSGVVQELPELPMDSTKLMIIVLGIYEVVIRVFPTVRSYSWLNFLIRIISVAVPNRRKIKLETGEERKGFFKLKEGGNPFKRDTNE